MIAGKVEVFNVVRDKLTKMRIASLKRGTIIIFVYDVDVKKTTILEQNIKLLKSYGFTTIYHVQSLQNFEDEIVHSTSLKNINDCFSTESSDEFKARFLAHKDILTKLKEIGFNDAKLWSIVNRYPPFCVYASQSSLDFVHMKNDKIK